MRESSFPSLFICQFTQAFQHYLKWYIKYNDKSETWLFFVQGKYNNWDKVDPAELFSRAPTEKKEANPKLNMVKFLQVG